MRGGKLTVIAAALVLFAGACGSDESSPNATASGVDASQAVPGLGGSEDGSTGASEASEPTTDAGPGLEAAPPDPAGAEGATEDGAATPAGSRPSVGAGAGPKVAAGGTGPAPRRAASPGPVKETPAREPSGSVPKPDGGEAEVAPVSPLPPDETPRDTSPIVIGSLGTLSGPAGSIIKQTAEGVQVWAAWVNAHGGANGHQVKFIMADDGGDPARYKAELQRLVESENVVALVGNPDALTGSAGVEYVTRKGVAYIGGDGGGDWFYQSPMYFPQGTVGHTFAEAELYDAALYAKERGKKKFGTVTCTEADFCRVADRIWNDQASKVGLDPVYRGRTSLVQPDFTAECLAAQRAGAEILEVALDSNSIRRLANSCARQGYKPLLGWPAGIAKDDQKKEPTLEGARVSLFAFSWTQGDTPATAEFQEAMKRYGKQLAPFTAGHSGGWAAAKLFEKAVSLIPGKVTRERILASLWTFRDETLGGLVSPRTFIEGQNAPRSRCWITIVIKDGEFRLQRGGKYVCR